MERVLAMALFDTLYFIYFKEVFQYVKNRVQNQEIAKDITQDVFVKACENKEFLRELNKTKIKEKLINAAQDLCEEFLQKQQVIPLTEEELNSVESLLLYTETVLHTKELRVFIEKILQKLKKNHRQAIWLFDIQHLPYKECAQKLGISEEAFSSLLRRARKAFLEQVIIEHHPSALKLPLSIYELTTLLTWFDILDFPENVEEEISLKTRAFFNGFIQNYDLFRKKTYPKNLEQFLLSRLPLNQKLKVADFGSGTGALTKILSPHVKTVYAVDYSSEMIHKLKKLIKEQKLINVVPLCLDIREEMRELRKSVDVGFCCMVLHHVFAPQKVLENIAETLVPGGYLLIADLVYTTESWMLKEEHDFWSGFKIPWLRKWLRSAGLEIIEIEENPSYVFRFESANEKEQTVEVPLLYALCKKPE